MGQDSFIPIATNAKSRNDLVERGFSRQPLRVDVDIARTLEALSHAAWSIQKDKYSQSWVKIALFRLQRMPSRETTSSSAGLVASRSELM